jgi:FkbM family methyltransferase
MKKILRASVNALPLAVRHGLKHIPGIALLQRWVVNRVISGEPFVHTINAGPASGLHFEVTLPDDKAIWAGTFEPEFSQVLARTVQPGDVCYDIGGYRGYMSGVFALAGAGRVIIFEPLPANIASLKRLIELNPNLPLQLEARAIGNLDGKVVFKIMPDSSMGKLEDSSFQPDKAIAGEIRVDISKLDTLVFQQKLAPPRVVKIDVEGTEVNVLDGAIRTLNEYHPKLLIEAHSEALSLLCQQRLAAWGYQVRQLEPEIKDPQQARHLAADPKAS